MSECIYVFVCPAFKSSYVLPAGQDVRSRLDVLIKCLEARGKAYETPAHKAAFALDPRVSSLLRQPDGDQQIGFALRPAWQDAVSSTMTEFIPSFFAVQAWNRFKNMHKWWSLFGGNGEGAVESVCRSCVCFYLGQAR